MLGESASELVIQSSGRRAKGVEGGEVNVFARYEQYIGLMYSK